jgi:hypothetical protein
MCFSATASFVASGALTGMGVATYAVARKKDKILVAIPILFGIQQAFEGVQWLYLDRGSSSLIAGYGFLFFALIVWPVYVPAFVTMLDKKRNGILKWLIVTGVVVAGYFVVVLATQPLRISERMNCVNYAFNLPAKWIITALYVVAILGPLLFSSRPIFRWFGLVVFASAVIAGTLYYRNFISVWCFFAAAVSAMFFLYVQHRRSMRLGGN